MSFINKLIWGEKTIKSPIFIKDFTKENKQLADLEELASNLKDGEKKNLINRDIAFLKKGIEGESNVYYEIKNSFLPIICLHDVRLKYDNYIAQYDFILVSNKFICVLETKMLNGNIIINPDGDFIRVIKDSHGREIKREGMYSPVAQNERHINILKEILYKENLAKTMPYISLVVIANQKSIINKNKCPAIIKNTIYKYDQVVSFLTKHQNDKDNQKDVLEKYMYNIANYLATNNIPLETDYVSKYRITENDFLALDHIKESDTKYNEPEKNLNARNENDLYKRLKEYRLLTAKRENIAAYMIFNNEEMERLISKHPTTEADLLEIKGFGKKKVEKYGKDLLDIFKGTLKK